jgi:hypothetical protein
MLVQFNWYVQQENIERLRCDIIIVFSSMARQPACGSGLPLCSSFTITLRHTTLGRTPLDEWSARRRDHYLSHINHNTHKRQTSMPHGCIRTRNPSKRAAADPRRRRRRHWDRLNDWWVINVFFLYNTSSSGTEDLQLQSEFFLPAVKAYLQTNNTGTWRPSRQHTPMQPALHPRDLPNSAKRIAL